MDNYPEEFTDLQKRPSDEQAELIADCCDKLFELFIIFAESPKKKAAVWPLQMMLLVLCPVSLGGFSASCCWGNSLLSVDGSVKLDKQLCSLCSQQNTPTLHRLRRLAGRLHLFVRLHPAQKSRPCSVVPVQLSDLEGADCRQ